MGAGDDVGDELGFHGIGHRRFQNPHDDCGTSSFDAPEPHGLSDHIGVRMQRGGPKSIRQHGCASCIWTIVGGVQQASPHGTESHHVEVVAIHNAGMDLAGRTEPDQSKVDLGKCAEFLDGFEAVADVLNFGDEKVAFSSPMPGAVWRR